MGARRRCRLRRGGRDLQQQYKELRKEIARFREEKAMEEADSIIGSGLDLGAGMKLYSGRIDGLGHLELKKLIDKVRSRNDVPFGIILVSREQDRANFVAAVDKTLLEKGFLPANDICRALGSRMKGGGGGRPGMAQGQGHASGDLDLLLSEALEEARAGFRT